MDLITEQAVAKAEEGMCERLKSGACAVKAHCDRRVSRVVIMHAEFRSRVGHFTTVG